MIARFEISTPNGKINAPPSKSYAHRAVICSAFSNKSIIKNIDFSDDIVATINALKALGARITEFDNHLEVSGFRREDVKNKTVINCLESGSTLRFLIPLCLTLNKEIIFKGSNRLFERPLIEYEKLCKKHGFKFQMCDEGLSVCGNLAPGKYEINSDISSQFVTGLIFACSFFDEKSEIKILGEPQSKPYIDITLNTLDSFGIKSNFNNNLIEVFGRNKCDDIEYTVEGDCSNSAYLEVFSFLGGNVIVDNLNDNTLQGDYVYKKMFTDIKMGVREFNLSNCPDLAPVMFAVSCLFGGARFFGTSRLKFKESDRANSMATELEKFGVKTTVLQDEVFIDASNLSAPIEDLSSHNDHRIAMALSLLCAKFGGTIKNAEAVNKSFPDFFKSLKKLGVRVD